VSGLCARGGFEIRSLEWTHGRLTRFSIKSTLGGICRLRTFQKLNGLDKFELRAADGENPNPFFETFKGAAPIISPQAKSIHREFQSFIYMTSRLFLATSMRSRRLTNDALSAL